MAKLFNQLRALGVKIVPDGTRFYNNRPVIGIRDVGQSLAFTDNKRVIEVDPLEDDRRIYNDQPVVGAVVIDDGRKFYNTALVVPAYIQGGAGNPGDTDPLIKRLAHRVYGPGYNSGSAPPIGTGAAVNYNKTDLVNLSGAAVLTCSVVLQGWTLRSTGTTDTANPFTVNGTIEYPVGTTVGTIPDTVVTPGLNNESVDIVLSDMIPPGATFAVRLSSVIASGQQYISNLGFAGLRNHALKSELGNVCLAGFGDSIMTNNGGAIYNAANGRCPVYLNSIIGTTAQTYGANDAANFVKQADLVGKLGVTHVTSNFGTNDYGAGTTLAVLQGYIRAMRDRVRALGAKWVHMTMTPRTTDTPTRIAASVLTSSGNSILATVADISKFAAGNIYNVAGADQTEYNGSFYCLSVDEALSIITLLFPGSATPVATGTITIGPWKDTSTIAFQTVGSSFYQPGPDSPRGQFNAWVRNGGELDGCIEWADAVEPYRDSGRWKVKGEDTLLPDIQLITVSAVTSTSRFNSDYSAGSNTIANGFVQPLSGANVGIVKSGNGNTGGDITVASAFPNSQVVGDQYYAVPGVSYMSDDGLHPRVSTGNKGGQIMLDNACAAWITARAA